jgi:hypothetical protein
MQNLLKALTWELMFQRSCVLANGWPDTPVSRREFVRRARRNSGATEG